MQSILNNRKIDRCRFVRAKIRLYQNGEIIAEYPASTGKSECQRLLKFSNTIKRRKSLVLKYGLYMPYALNFYGDYYIHELPYWPSGYRRRRTFGYASFSWMCRVGVGVAETVYNFAEIGTKVVIHQ